MSLRCSDESEDGRADEQKRDVLVTRRFEVNGWCFTRDKRLWNLREMSRRALLKTCKYSIPVLSPSRPRILLQLNGIQRPTFFRRVALETKFSGLFFFPSVTGDTADQSSESSEAETGNAPPHNLHREKLPVSQLVLEYTHNYSSVAGRPGRYRIRTHTEIKLSIRAGIYERCRNFSTRIDATVRHTFAFAIRFANLAK